jgi:hypothetical protein
MASYRRAWRTLGVALAVATCVALGADSAAVVAATLARAWVCKQVQLSHVDIEPPSGSLRYLVTHCDPNDQPRPTPKEPRRPTPYTMENPTRGPGAR